METALTWLEFLEEYRIDDALCADAYANATKKERQCIKNAIAYHALQNEQPERANSFNEYKTRGFWHKIKKNTAPWLIAVSAPEFTSPARLVAALMPAILAHVPIFFIALKGSDAPDSRLLLALELMGVENIFCLSSTEPLLNALQTKGMENYESKGRFVFLHHNLAICSASSVRSLYPTLQSLYIPYFEDQKPPLLHFHESVTQEQEELIYFAQPDAQVVTDKQSFAHACYLHDEERLGFPYAQIWHHGLEACWVHTHYTQDFFYNTAYSAALKPIKM